MTDGVTVLSLSASLLEKERAVTGCLCQIILNQIPWYKFKSCENSHVEAEQCKRNCVKWDLSVISKTNCGCSVLSSPMQLWIVNNNKYYYYNYPCPHHAGICARRDIVPLILNLPCRRRWLIRITSQAIYPFESTH